MAIHTFSTKGKKPEDTELVVAAKQICSDKGLNFSAVVIIQLRKWVEEQKHAKS